MEPAPGGDRATKGARSRHGHHGVNVDAHPSPALPRPPACSLWIRRVLVRAQEGQLEGSALLSWCGAFFCFRPLLPFLLPFLNALAVRRLTNLIGEAITFSMVASSAC